jgi:hypothetical protein
LVPDVTLPRGGGTQTVIVPAGRRIYVSYVLTGAVQMSASSTGHDLAKVTALGVSTPPAPVASTTYSVMGAPILALACSPNLPDAVARPCGRAMADGWRVDLRGVHRGDRVTARMDLS